MRGLQARSQANQHNYDPPGKVVLDRKHLSRSILTETRGSASTAEGPKIRFPKKICIHRGLD